MALKLNELQPKKGATRNSKRVGRGPGSGWGVTAAKGSKGHKSRSGFHQSPALEGGQMPFIRRIPKRGFHNLFRKRFVEVNLAVLDKKFKANEEVNLHTLAERGLLKGLSGAAGVKVLGKGEIRSALVVKVHAVSEGARKKIESAGGRVEVLTLV